VSFPNAPRAATPRDDDGGGCERPTDAGGEPARSSDARDADAAAGGEELEVEVAVAVECLTLTADDGAAVYSYARPVMDAAAVAATALGGVLTGLLSVGTGESGVGRRTSRVSPSPASSAGGGSGRGRALRVELCCPTSSSSDWLKYVSANEKAEWRMCRPTRRLCCCAVSRDVHRYTAVTGARGAAERGARARGGVLLHRRRVSVGGREPRLVKY
jgi:hypothetical protein